VQGRVLVGGKIEGMNNRRSNIDVMADILRLGEAGKTEIMYSANMSYRQLQRYLNSLTQGGFIERVKLTNPVETYRVTKKGLRLLKTIDRISEMLAQAGEVRKSYVTKAFLSQMVNDAVSQESEKPA
jgi:predicted transcriptional regulator